METQVRDYGSIATDLATNGSRAARMQAVADALWDALGDTGVSWVGFYVEEPDAPDETRLVLGPHRDTPACSPIGLGGVCGRGFATGRTVIVEDVRTLGDAYIACDPLDLSEIVIPLADEDHQVWGVLDLDSHEVGAFDVRDEMGLTRILRTAGLLPPEA